MPNSAPSEGLPHTVQEFVTLASARQEEHFRTDDHARHGFVASDPVAVYGTLSMIATRGLSRGETFCEWGSGCGIITGLATLLGFESYGIEIQPELVTVAEELTEEFEISAQFAEGTFVPRTCSIPLSSAPADHPWWHSPGEDGHALLGLDPQEVDVVFAYPWPGERSIFEAVFLQIASEGSLLVTYEDGYGTRLQRWTDDRTLFAVD